VVLAIGKRWVVCPVCAWFALGLASRKWTGSKGVFAMTKEINNEEIKSHLCLLLRSQYSSFVALRDVASSLEKVVAEFRSLEQTIEIPRTLRVTVDDLAVVLNQAQVNDIPLQVIRAALDSLSDKKAL
jgi:hypothetical protein